MLVEIKYIFKSEDVNMSNKIKFDREAYFTNIEALKSITGIKLSNEIAKELSEKYKKYKCGSIELYETLRKNFGIVENEYNPNYFNYVDVHKKELTTIKSEFKRRIEKAKNNKNKTIDKKGKLRSTKGLKLENWMAKLVVSDGKIYNSIGKFVDYEIPAGKKKENIDLLSANRNKYAYVVELKGCNSKEYLKSIIEILHYYIAMKGYRVRESPLKYHTDVKGIELIKMAILIYKDGTIKRYLYNQKYKYITMLLDLFNIDCYEYSINNDNSIKDIEKLKLPSISK